MKIPVTPSNLLQQLEQETRCERARAVMRRLLEKYRGLADIDDLEIAEIVADWSTLRAMRRAIGEMETKASTRALH